MTTLPSPSPPISLSHPGGLQGALCTSCIWHHLHLPPIPPCTGCLTQIQTHLQDSIHPGSQLMQLTACIKTTTIPLPTISYPYHHLLQIIRSRESFHSKPTRGSRIDYGVVSNSRLLKRADRDDSPSDRNDVEEDAYGFPLGLGCRYDRIKPATHPGASDHHDHVYAHEDLSNMHHIQCLQLQSTLIQTQHQRLFAIKDVRREMSDMQAELLALREPTE
ncbi:hypothetical protein Tco_0754994 [Tanacetum coccineum]